MVVCSSTKNEIEVTSDIDIQEKKQILSKNSEFHELHSIQRGNTHISKDRTSFSESKCNLESLSPAHELDMGQAISDKGQSFKEDTAFTEYCSTEEKTGLSMESTATNLLIPSSTDKTDLNINKKRLRRKFTVR